MDFFRMDRAKGRRHSTSLVGAGALVGWLVGWTFSIDKPRLKGHPFCVWRNTLRDFFFPRPQPFFLLVGD